MKNLMVKRGDWLLFGAVLFVSLLRFIDLNGGLVLGEPDEFIHQSVVENLRRSFWPTYSGVPWFFQMPLYPYLGFLFSWLWPERYLALRFVSVLASVLFIVGTYLFVRYQSSARVGFWAALFLALSPFSIYISRLALLDSTYVAFGFLFLYSFQLALDRESKLWALTSGLFLTAALMTKYSALVFLIIATLFFLGRLFVDNWRDLKENLYFKLNTVTLIPPLLVSLIVVPVLYLMRKHDPYYFKLQLFTSLGFIRDFWRVQGGQLSFLNYLKDIPWWLTPPLLLLFVFGLLISLSEWRRWKVIWLALGVTLIIVLPFRPFYPRYFYPLVPFVAVFAALGWERVWLKVRFWPGLGLLVVLLLLILPTSGEAFSSTQHRLIERGGDYVQGYKLWNPWVFSNYWPNIIGQAAGTIQATWMSNSVWDGRAFVGNLQAPPSEVFKAAGGFVILEKLYANSKFFIQPQDRIDAWSRLSQELKPVVIISEATSNFPNFRGQGDELRIYFNPPPKHL